MTRILCALALVGFGCLLASAPAQTFLVDPHGRPGSHFTTIVDAVAAVPDGATLRVVGGRYQPFVIDGKGITILGTGAVVGVGPPVGGVVIRNLSASQRVVLVGLELSGSGGGILWAHDCAGSVTFDGLRVNPYPTAAVVLIERCDQVLLRDVRPTSLVPVGAALRDSGAALERCEFAGQSGYQGGPVTYYSSPGLVVQRGLTRLSDCEVGGGIGTPALGGPQPAIQATAARIELRGPGRLGALGVPIIAGTAQVDRDPAFAFVGAPVGPGVQLTRRTMTTVLGDSASPGQSLSAAVTGLAVPTVLVVGLPGPPVAVAGLVGELWVDPAVHVFAAFGQPPLAGSVAVPAGPGFLGLQLAWQAVAFVGQTAEVSNPCWVTVR
ncbi:MAG: hypothetical protein NXI31_17360 [bacterium]|nr:hypothetical protein [bacterium]